MSRRVICSGSFMVASYSVGRIPAPRGLRQDGALASLIRLLNASCTVLFSRMTITFKTLTPGSSTGTASGRSLVQTPQGFGIGDAGSLSDFPRGARWSSGRMAARRVAPRRDIPFASDATRRTPPRRPTRRAGVAFGPGRCCGSLIWNDQTTLRRAWPRAKIGPGAPRGKPDRLLAKYLSSTRWNTDPAGETRLNSVAQERGFRSSGCPNSCRAVPVSTSSTASAHSSR